MTGMQSLLSASKTLSRSQCRYNSDRRQYKSRSSTDICFVTFLNEPRQRISSLTLRNILLTIAIAWLCAWRAALNASWHKHFWSQTSCSMHLGSKGNFLSKNLSGDPSWFKIWLHTSLRYSTISAFSGPSGHCSLQSSAREMFALVTCNVDSRHSTNLSMRADCAAFEVGR